MVNLLNLRCQGSSDQAAVNRISISSIAVDFSSAGVEVE